MEYCNYHPEKESKITCSRCRRNICDEDTSLNMTCKICFNNNKINMLPNRGVVILMFFFLSIFIIGPISMFPLIFEGVGTNNYFGPPLLIIIPFFMIFFSFPIIIMFKVLSSAKNAPKISEQLRKENEEFFASLPVIPEGISLENNPQTHYKWTNTIIFCQQCGEEIFLKNKFCSSCGDSTDDEREHHKKMNR